MRKLTIEHLLLFVLVIFLLYHLVVKRSICCYSNGFTSGTNQHAGRIGWQDPDEARASCDKSQFNKCINDSIKECKGKNLAYCKFNNADLTNADFTNANLIGANFTNADLTKASLTNTILEGADLTGANLKLVDLRGADLRGADLMGADLTGAILKDAGLMYANLTDADLMGADLTGADLKLANLRGADLKDADLMRADLTGANLTYAVFVRANLNSVTRPNNTHTIFCDNNTNFSNTTWENNNSKSTCDKPSTTKF
jgi:uncharacterized protein YjbI with pentapeptide repeats